jgi:hypothetical protein
MGLTLCLCMCVQHKYLNTDANYFWSNFVYLPHGRCRVVELHSITHTNTPQSVGPLQTRDRSVAGILSLTTHKTKSALSPEGFESAIPASERPQTLTLGRSTTGIVLMNYYSEEKT